MGLLLLSIFICFIVTILLIQSAKSWWYMCIFVPIISADFLGLLPSPTSDEAFYALASDTCILFLTLLLYADSGSQDSDTQSVDSSDQSLSKRFGIATFLAVYGLARNMTPALFSEPTQLLSDVREVALVLFRSYISLLGLTLLWQTHRSKKVDLDR